MQIPCLFLFLSVLLLGNIYSNPVTLVRMVVRYHHHMLMYMPCRISHEGCKCQKDIISQIKWQNRSCASRNILGFCFIIDLKPIIIGKFKLSMAPILFVIVSCLIKNYPEHMSLIQMLHTIKFLKWLNDIEFNLSIGALNHCSTLRSADNNET